MGDGETEANEQITDDEAAHIVGRLYGRCKTLADMALERMPVSIFLNQLGHVVSTALDVAKCRVSEDFRSRLEEKRQAKAAKAFADDTSRIADAVGAAAIGIAVAKRVVDEHVLGCIIPHYSMPGIERDVARIVADEIRKASAKEWETSFKACACGGDHGAPEGSADRKPDMKLADRPGDEDDLAMAGAVKLFLQQWGEGTIVQLAKVAGVSERQIADYASDAKDLHWQYSLAVHRTKPKDFDK